MTYRPKYEQHIAVNNNPEKWTSEVSWPRASEYKIKNASIVEAGERTTYILDSEDKTQLTSFSKLETKEDIVGWSSNWGLPWHDSMSVRKVGDPSERLLLKDVLRAAQELRFTLGVLQHVRNDDIYELTKVVAIWDGETYSTDWYLSLNTQKGRQQMNLTVRPATFKTSQVQVAFLIDDRSTVITQPGAPWKKDWKSALREAARLFIAGRCNKGLAGVHQIVEVARTHDTNQLIFAPKLRPTNPLETMYLSLFQELTGAQEVGVCPHPKCGVRFFKTRKDKSTCGNKTCQNWLTERKKRNGGKP
jgi:hypothetical protein